MKFLKFLFLANFLALVLAESPMVCQCTKEYRPECGTDGVTYPNKCERECQRVEKANDGPCAGENEIEPNSCVCPMILKEECGMDGKTYPNECERKCQGVEKAKDGKCDGITGGNLMKPKQCTCTKEYHPECGKDGKTYPNKCERECQGVQKAKDGACSGGNAGGNDFGKKKVCPCPKIHQPECGTDLTTYANKCERECQGVKKQYDGPCKPVNGGGAKPGKKGCVCPLLYKPECGANLQTYPNACERECDGVAKGSDGPCKPVNGGGAKPGKKDCVCTMEYKPECGADHQTYSNKCERECQGVTKYHDGECKSSNKECVCTMEYKPECGADQQTYPNKCERECQGVAKHSDGPCKPVNGGGAKAEKKDCVCPLNYKPECGKDGQTYDNTCLRKCQGVEKAKDGACSGGNAGGNDFGKKKVCPCPKILKPECGTNAQTYPNKCERECQGVKKSYDGPCKPVNGGGGSVDGGASAGGSKGCICTKEQKPECGVDGETYPNQCMRKCKSVPKAYNGPCMVDDSQSPDGKPCTCPRHMRPECGMDGKTYNNDCLRQCAGVAKASDGPCGVGGSSGGNLIERKGKKVCACPKINMPECGTDLTTYANKCERECQGVKKQYDGPCKPVNGGGAKAGKKDCVCTMEYKPVCGGDLQTYPNDCERKCQGVSKAYDGPCKPLDGGGAKAGKKGCVCPLLYKPECGANLQTYPNKCERECEGVGKQYDGPCKPVNGGGAKAEKKDCVCPMILHEECGKDGTTYSNACERKCQGVEKAKDGKCDGITGGNLIPPKQCTCTMEYHPECGKDGKTYPNKCERECQGVEKAKDGACSGGNAGGNDFGKKKVCPCPKIHQPECGTDLTTYANKCERECQGVKKQYDGPCKPVNGGGAKPGQKTCTCTKEYKPECGKDGKTYPNKCERECHGVQKAKDGQCSGPIGRQSPGEGVCPMLYEPECGMDGTTYGNACEREKAGVKKQSDGECEGFSGDNAAGTKPNNQLCFVEEPECGVDGKTYKNACEREQAGVEKQADGPCTL